MINYELKEFSRSCNTLDGTFCFLENVFYFKLKEIFKYFTFSSCRKVNLQNILQEMSIVFFWIWFTNVSLYTFWIYTLYHKHKNNTIFIGFVIFRKPRSHAQFRVRVEIYIIYMNFDLSSVFCKLGKGAQKNILDSIKFI